MKYISHNGKSLPVAQNDLVPPSGNVDSAVVLKPGGRASASIREFPGYCSAQDQVPVTAAWLMELSGVVGPITLMNETTFDVCSGNLPFVADIEVGTFDIEK